MYNILTLQEASKFMNVTPWQLSCMASKGEVYGFKIGTMWRFDKTDLAIYKHQKDCMKPFENKTNVELTDERCPDGIKEFMTSNIVVIDKNARMKKPTLFKLYEEWCKTNKIILYPKKLFYASVEKAYKLRMGRTKGYECYCGVGINPYYENLGTNNINIKVDPDEMQALKICAKERGTTVSGFVSMLIVDYIRRYYNDR